MKRSISHWNAWGQYIAVAAAYEAVYEIARYCSQPQFLLTTGLRLACMLLMPARFWPALAVGEFVPLAENALFCADRFGTAWAVLIAIPTVVFYWPVLGMVRSKWRLYDADGRLHMQVIVYASIVASIITAGLITATWMAAFMHDPGKFPAHDPAMVLVSRLVGSYLGALTLTPVILSLRDRYLRRQDVLTVAAVWRSTLLRDVLWWVIPALAVLDWLALTANVESVRQLAQFALLLPVLGLAWRHGWHGTAVGGLLASFALASTAHGLLDNETLKVQTVMSVVLSGALILGARSPATRRMTEADQGP